MIKYTCDACGEEEKVPENILEDLVLITGYTKEGSNITGKLRHVCVNVRGEFG